MTKPQIRVLIVEDDLVDRMACRRALAQDPDYEFVLSEAETGREGLQLAHMQKPDCILLDYHLPDLDGLEFLAELRNDLGEISVPVMMLTGADNAAVTVEAMRRGAQDYLVKDVNRQYLELLPAVIQRVLRERRTRMEKKQVEENLAHAEAKYRNLVEQIPAITYIAALDETNRILYISPQIKMLDFPPEQWLDTPGVHLNQIHPEDRMRVLDELTKSRATGTPLRCEYRLLSRGGTVFWFRDEARVVRDELGRSLFLQGILVDITESKQVEAELRQHRWRLEEVVAKRTNELAEVNKHLVQDIAERERVQAELTIAKAAAEKANLAKSNFISRMSHELRSPLNSILGFAQLIEAGSPAPTPTQQARLKEILRAGWYLLDLINETLDLATIESGNIVLSQESVSLAEVLSECQAMIEPQAQKSGIRMAFPQFDSSCFVKADRTRLKQILINLLSNAIKYNRSEGAVEVTCSMSTAERLRISVKDTGEGLSPEKLAQLFQPFNRLGQEARAEEGTGIGLVVSKQLIELMEGEIGVESTVGVGSVFWIELGSAVAIQLATGASEPFEAVEALQHGAPPEVAETEFDSIIMPGIPATVTAADILNASILIVDDREANVQLLEQTLHEAGYRCITSTLDPHAVCALHRANHYDLILLDIEMPGMNGFQVMEGLKKIEADGYPPVLALTAEQAHKLRALQGGAKDFISKPFDLAEVLMRVHNMLEVRLLHEAARNHGKRQEHLALNDPLTGLANRRLLADRMSMAIVHARRNKSAMAVVYLDLDGFKQINDTLGHGAGDTLLKMVAERLVATVREDDTVARVGGDEFIIALWHISDTDYAATVALKVIEAVAQPYSIEGHTVRVTASAGVGIYPIHGEDADTLMQSADLALYEAKRAGKNVYRIAEQIGGSVQMAV
jgi:diguanylate cyclase (GGDEF)-like protein/PAS domain S-box-containing protein